MLWFVLLLRSRQTISTIETILKEAEAIPAFLPNIGTLRDALRKGKEWSAKVETIQV
jgi:histone demethylase JARID1